MAHDALPYNSGSTDDVYAYCKSIGKFLPTKRTEGISTTDLITRILRDYDVFVSRNLERGVSPKSLNVSLAKRSELWVRRQVEKTVDTSWNVYCYSKGWLPRGVVYRVEKVEQWAVPRVSFLLKHVLGKKDV